MNLTHFGIRDFAKSILLGKSLWESKKIIGLTAVGLMGVVLTQSSFADLVMGESQALEAASGSIDAQTPARLSDRNLMRQNLQSAQRIQPRNNQMEYSAIESETPVVVTPPPVVQSPIYPSPVYNPAPTYAPAPIYAPAPQVYTPAPVVQVPAQQYYAPPTYLANQTSQTSSGHGDGEVEALSKSELLRRARVREELKNEDLLQERLESLRLKDEKSRTSSLIGGKSLNEMGSVNEVVVEAQPVFSASPVQQPLTTSVVASDGSQTILAQNSVLPPQGVSVVSTPETEEEIRISLTPRGGLGGLVRNQAFRVNSRYSLGVEASVEVSPRISFELGYTFSELGIAMTQTNPWVLAQTFQNARFETIAMRQNIFDMGMKFYLTKPTARVRPYLGGGVGYSRSFINYDTRILNSLYQYGQGYAPFTRDYELNSFLGKISGGLDVKITKSISAVGGFNYYHVLRSRENGPLNNNAFYYGNTAASYTPYGYSMFSPGAAFNSGAYYNYGVPADERQLVSQSLSRAAFFTVLTGIQFSF